MFFLYYAVQNVQNGETISLVKFRRLYKSFFKC